MSATHPNAFLDHIRHLIGSDPAEGMTDSQLLERFQREARAASSLNHPNICTIHAIEQHERKHFIVMELLKGETLAQKMTGKPIEIFDPVNPTNNVAAMYDDGQRKKMVSAAQDALEAITEARFATTRGRAIECWQDVLGPSFRG